MEVFTMIIIFLIGLAVGSFINVVSFRYEPERGLFNTTDVRGRSKCMRCLNTLKWYELIPLMSFIIQRRKCRSCNVTLSWQYPDIEIAAGILAVLLFQAFSGVELGIWILATFFLLVITAVDFRLKIIPDEANIIIGILGIARIITLQTNGGFGNFEGSSVGHYAFMFGFRKNIWLNHGFAALLGLLIFGAIIALTKGRGMGMGDLKLAVVGGILLGWPDSIFALMIAFIAGSLWGIGLIVVGRKSLKSAIPFGPFIVLGFFIMIFFGQVLMSGYFDIVDKLIS
jgi:prepilin signal peptidase PulO-like enzyme (type II secretory pathway)